MIKENIKKLKLAFKLIIYGICKFIKKHLTKKVGGGVLLK